MKLPRPYIPIPVRIKVARRQLRGFGASEALMTRGHGERQDVYLDRLLTGLSLYFENLFRPLQLDHDPALCNRKFSPRTGKYTPDANDPRFLIYRTKEDHDRKTRLRGDGAQRSDLAQRRYFKRIEARKNPKKKFKPRRAKHIRRISHA